MKPIKISIKGFNSFIEEQNIDFEKLMSKGMFGIFGPTGSGKSTILDAVTFALYGKIARETGSHSQYININSESATVVFEFEVETDIRERYKIIREIKRNKKGATNTTQCKIIKMGEYEEVLGEKERETTEEIKKIIGLEYNDFVKTVVLPQGSFNEFIKLEGKDRREILERLFNLQKYGKLLEDQIGIRVKKVETERNLLEGEINSYGDIDTSLLENQEKEIEENKLKLEEIRKNKQKSDKNFSIIKNTIKMQENLEQLDKEYKIELSKKDEFTALEKEIKNSLKANIISPLILDYENLTEKGKETKNICKEKEKEYNEKNNIYKEVDQKFTKWEKLKKEDYVELLKKEHTLSSLNTVFKKYNENKNNHFKLEKEINDFITKQKEINEKLEKFDLQRTDIRRNIEEINKYLQENKIDVNRKNNLSRAVYIKNKIIDTKENIDSFKKENENLLSKLKIDEDNLTNFEILKEKIHKKIMEIKGKIDILSTNDKSKADYTTNIKHIYEKDLENIQKLDSLTENKNTLEHEIEKISQEIINLDKNYQEINLKLEDLQQEYNQKLKLNTINDVKNSLCEGDICPICSSKIVKSEINVEREFDIKKLSDDLNSLLTKERQISNDILILNQNKNTKNDKTKELTLEIEKLCNYSNLTEELITKKYLRDCSEAEEVVQKIEGLKKALQEAEKENTDFDNKIIVYELNIKNIKSNLEKNNEKIKEFEEEISLLEDKLENLKIDDNIDNFEFVLEKLEKLEKVIEEKNIKRDALLEKSVKLDNQSKEIEQIFRDVEINLSKNKEKLKANKFAMDESEEELIVNLGSIKDPSSELLHIQNEIEEIDKKYLYYKKEKEELLNTINDLKTEIESKNASLNNLREQAREKQNNIYRAIEEHEIYNINSYEGENKLQKLNELKILILSWGKSKEIINQKEELLSNYKKNLDEKKGAIENIKKIIGDNFYSTEEYENAELENKELEKKFDEITKLLNTQITRYEQNKERALKLENLLKKKLEIEKKQSILKELKSVVGAKKFVEFMAMKQLRYVTMQATKRLNEITNGAYSLEVDEDGSFKIRDNKNGGALRTVKTLSGGETFVVSLSLALALSTQIQLKGVSPLELFFLDEGFGTLDDDLLEVVIDSLEKIQNDRLNVGVISHIEQLKQRIPVKLVVSPAKSGEGGSKVKIEYS